MQRTCGRHRVRTLRDPLRNVPGPARRRSAPDARPARSRGATTPDPGGGQPPRGRRTPDRTGRSTSQDHAAGPRARPRREAAPQGRIPRSPARRPQRRDAGPRGPGGRTSPRSARTSLRAERTSPRAARTSLWAARTGPVPRERAPGPDGQVPGAAGLLPARASAAPGAGPPSGPRPGPGGMRRRRQRVRRDGCLRSASRAIDFAIFSASRASSRNIPLIGLVNPVK